MAQAGETGVSPKAVILDGAGTPSLWPDYWKNVVNFAHGELYILAGYFSYLFASALVAGAAVIAVIFVIIKKTWFGRIIRAASQDREMAEQNGVNTTRLNMLSFGPCCVLAAAAGVILAPVFPVTPTAGVAVALTAFVVVVLGGMGSLWGCVVWGLVLGLGALCLKMGGIYLSLTTLAFSLILHIVIVNEYDVTRGTMGLQVPGLMVEYSKISYPKSARGRLKETLSCLLVEQNVEQALSFSRRAYILESGRMTRSGNSADIRRAYLGM